ncbi:MAG TPA: hypothetical protein DDW65_01405 [Firmicutes bacterium]|jgi:ABC-type glycerol-3-phosphate transport system substrate-binding protein|nr:hypothetical protein [Bacillota bacterium]
MSIPLVDDILRNRGDESMRKRVMLLLSLLMLVVLILSVTSFGKAKDIKLTVWINGRDSYIGPEEQKLPQDQWYISQCFRRFEQANPGVKIQMIVPPDQFEAHQQFKAAGLAGNAPDIANLWTGQFTFAEKDVIRPIDDLVPKDDLNNIQGWDTVRLGFNPHGKIMGYPCGEVQMAFMLYNKKLVKAAGLDFEANPPRTMKAFDEALKQIKETGVTPIITDESYPTFIIYQGVYWWMQLTGTKTILKECNGDAKFVNDKGLSTMLAYYNSLYKNGYINPDALTSSDSWNKFLQGKGAITPQVTSVLSDAEKALGSDNVGVILPPDMDGNILFKNRQVGGPGQSLVVSKDCKNPKMAVKLLSFISSKSEVMKFQKIQAKVPLRRDVTTRELGWKEGTAIFKIFNWSKNYVYWCDDQLSSDVVNIFDKIAPLTLTGKLTPQQLAKQLDDQVKEGKN